MVSAIKYSGVQYHLVKALLCWKRGDATRTKYHLEAGLGLADRGEERAREGDVRGALADNKQALSFYRGEFFPDDRYPPWLTEKREAIAVRYRRVLFNSAQLHETRGALNKAISAFDKVIEVEPTLEEVYRRLMRLHSRLGHRNQALNTYRLCERNLRDILDVEPEPETIALYQRIKENA